VKYLSVCSGVEAATVAWHDLGWEAVAYSEIEKFPSEVLAHHYPTVPNMGDMTKYKEWNLNESIGLLVGGTPCQSFSVAGLRKGLEDVNPRGAFGGRPPAARRDLRDHLALLTITSDDRARVNGGREAAVERRLG